MEPIDVELGATVTPRAVVEGESTVLVATAWSSRAGV